MRRYNIQNTTTGLYYLGGEWHEEPEWFDAGEAARLMGALCDKGMRGLVINAHKFDYLSEVA